MICKIYKFLRKLNLTVENFYQYQNKLKQLEQSIEDFQNSNATFQVNLFISTLQNSLT